VDPRTVDVYAGGAAAYRARRRAYQPERAASFAARLPAGAVRLDLGSGPGHYAPHLGRPLVAADPALAMVTEAVAGAPDVLGLVADAAALPVRRGALAGVWASKSLQHLVAEHLPLALAEIHGALAVGGVLDVTVFDRSRATRAGETGQAGPGPTTAATGGAPGATTGPAVPAGEAPVAEVTGDDDDFPGRLFTFWPPHLLERLLVGAGFDVEQAEAAPAGDGGAVHRVLARATRARTLSDTVGPGMRLLVCGLNPSLYAADVGIGYARPGNRFWPAALAAGLVTVDRDPRHALRHHGLGMTDVVKRATVGAAELTPAEYRAGLDRVRWLVGWLRPRAICFVGLAGWRTAVDRRAGPGVQPVALAGVPAYVMPSTSGLNAHASATDLAAHLRAAAALADGA